MIDFNKKPTTSTPKITSKVAKEIYDLIKEYGDADKAYKMKGNSDYEPEHFKEVEIEAEKVMAEIALLKSGTKVISEAEYELDEKTGENVITKEAKYFVAKDDLDILSQLSSTLLDCEQLLEDSK